MTLKEELCWGYIVWRGKSDWFDSFHELLYQAEVRLNEIEKSGFNSAISTGFIKESRPPVNFEEWDSKEYHDILHSC